MSTLTICPVFVCWFCKPPNTLSRDYISLVRDGNKVWCGTCGNFLGHDIVVPQQIGALVKSMLLDCNMHIYRKPNSNVPSRACGQDVLPTTVTLIERTYDRFNMELVWFELEEREPSIASVKEGQPLSDQKILIDLVPEPVKPSLRKFQGAGFYLTGASLDGSKKVLRLECRYLPDSRNKFTVVRVEMHWPDNLLNPPADPVKEVISKAAAKKIFLEAAENAGVPTPALYPKATTDPTKLTAAMTKMLNATRVSMLNYLPDGEELSLEEQTEWNAEILRQAGWVVSVAVDGLSLSSKYPDAC